MDKRHTRRRKIAQELFAASFINESSKTEISDRTKEILKHSEELDTQIALFAQKFSIDKIARADVSILRLALFELLIEKKTPPRVIINEAVELAKEIGGETSPGFVNAVLGKVYENKNK